MTLNLQPATTTADPREEPAVVACRGSSQPSLGATSSVMMFTKRSFSSHTL